MKKTLFAILTVATMIFSLNTHAFAETIELVTYFPTVSNQGNVDADNIITSTLTIDGNATDEPDAFLLTGINDGITNALFLPGENTANFGTPQIRVGIGTATPEGILDISSQAMGDTLVRIVNETLQGDTILRLQADPADIPGSEGSSVRIEFVQDGGLFHSAAGHGLGVLGSNRFLDENVFTIANAVPTDSANSGGIAFATGLYDREDNTGYPAAQTRLFIDPEGRVGLGTTDPDSSLHIRNDEGRPILHLEGENPYLRINDTETAENEPEPIDFRLFAANRYGRISSDKSISIHLDNDNNSDTERLVITSNSSSFGNDTKLMTVHENGGVNIGNNTITPPSSAPNGNTGNLSVNDVFLRSSNKWLSQAQESVFNGDQIGSGQVFTPSGSSTLGGSVSLTSFPGATHLKIISNIRARNGSASVNVSFLNGSGTSIIGFGFTATSGDSNNETDRDEILVPIPNSAEKVEVSGFLGGDSSATATLEFYN